MLRVNGNTGSEPNGTAPLGMVAEALRRLGYGAIYLTMHDATVRQIDVTERKRINP